MFNIPANSLHKTIFVRLLVIYIIVILPIILLGIYLYNWSYNNASQEISRNTIVQLNTYLEDLNREIEWIEIQQFDILADKELQKMALAWEVMDNYEKKISITYLLHRLTSIKNTSPFIKDVSIHIPSIDKTFSATNSVQEFNHVRYESILACIQGTKSRIIKQGDSLSLMTLMFGGWEVGKPLFVIQIELNNDRLRGDLDTLNIYSESGTFLISKDWGEILATGEESSNIIQSFLSVVKGSSEFTEIMDVEVENYHTDKAHSEELGLFVVKFIPEEMVRRPLNKFSKWAWVFAFASIVAIVIYSYSTYKLVHRPLLRLVEGFKRMEGGDLNIPIVHKKEDEFGFIYDRYNNMLIKLKKLIDRDYKLKLMMQEAELKQLQSQINPHFLYNSFFILNSLAKIEDIERIELFTKMLGEYFRFITRNGESNVTLMEEIKHARMYTEIQNLRFSRRISVLFDELPKELELIKVPRLIVQPIIENAYEHSLEKMPDEGFLRVSFEKRGDIVSIVVEDNGDTLSDEEIHKLGSRIANINELQEMTGIINIHRRIALTYGEGSGLFLSRSTLNGLKVTIRIKLKEEGNDV
ncbi:sensor histidine kinase [Lederbergia wuyishanensis]|uniref:Two-component system sensor histidine kinase YesM n=1 Tax=Lederbergia wuyishanensis TaxID=1347903 RepID=A0ABU0D9T4_9BACI|nr:histidine kinase [Lederbergia wuyishanensis]MCJ8008431.1 histidine kinase [Lederbergia wuyishanensis]MDQ0345173.1 two-component system sensor histidine kinase YesM [Lederbergia wuyishanensis]